MSVLETQLTFLCGQVIQRRAPPFLSIFKSTIMQEVIPLAVGEQRADCGDISLKDQPINKLINNYKKEIKLKNQAYCQL